MLVEVVVFLLELCLVWDFETQAIGDIVCSLLMFVITFGYYLVYCRMVFRSDLSYLKDVPLYYCTDHLLVVAALVLLSLLLVCAARHEI